MYHEYYFVNVASETIANVHKYLLKQSSREDI